MNVHSNGGVLLIVIFVVLGIIALLYIKKHFKKIVIPNVFLVTGAVKSGKTLLSIHYAIKLYKKNLRHFYIAKAIGTLFGRKDEYQYPPMLYSNMPLAKIKFNYLTKDIIERKVRIPDHSVVLIDEASLLADSMLYNDVYINDTLTAFYKLFAHYTHGGYCIINTQSIKDNHFSVKRCIGNYFYLHHTLKLPFISIMYVRELLQIDDDNTINVVDKDLELSLRKVLIWNTTFKKYDHYALSSFTDDKPMQVDYDVAPLDYKDDLKVYYLVTYQHFGKAMNEYMQNHLEELRKQLEFDENGVKIEDTNDEKKN